MRHGSCAGIVRVVDAGEVTAVVNTGDDTELHGLSISPDLDTITYTLAEAIDPERGWGLAGETWHAMAALERYAAVRPAGSDAAPTWFNLGDRDLATHLYRTARLGEGATLTEVTAEIARAWGLGISLLPMTDDRLRTMVTVAGHGEIGFQDYFVRLRHDVEVGVGPVRPRRRDAVSPGARRDRDGRRGRDRPVEPDRVDRADPCVARCRRAARRSGASRSSPCRRSWAARP